MSISIYHIGVICMLCVAALSVISSIIILTLLRQLKRWNGYLRLVNSLTICQAIYDISFFLILGYSYYPCRVVYELLHTFGGIASSLW